MGLALRGSLRGSLGGQHDAYWAAYYIYARDVLGVAYDPAHSETLDLWADVARSTGWWWPYEGVCIMSDRPATVRMEPIAGDRGYGVQAHRIHCPDGPAVAYRDGWTGLLHG